MGFDKGKAPPKPVDKVFPWVTVLVSAKGLIPCLSKCPPNGLTAAWANVEVGK